MKGEFYSHAKKEDKPGQRVNLQLAEKTSLSGERKDEGKGADTVWPAGFR